MERVAFIRGLLTSIKLKYCETKLDVFGIGRSEFKHLYNEGIPFKVDGILGYYNLFYSVYRCIG